ncbi:hypothetical protein [Thorsellia kenyensis]|uniref:Uncharacterized protein n=1 Tax=Thorsellia kenyensis TaxID=1549888 RepID=A0ABV6C8I4_9GAMM
MTDKKLKYSITVTEHDGNDQSSKGVMLFIYDNNEFLVKKTGLDDIEKYNLLAKSTRLIAAYLTGGG